MANSDYPNHVVLARDLQAYLRWRNANARHPDVIAAQRRERARIRSERHQRWGRPHTPKLPDQSRRTLTSPHYLASFSHSAQMVSRLCWSRIALGHGVRWDRLLK
jgi:hypothetical protein